MRLSISRLGRDIYPILDEALNTGIPVEIVRKGQILRIVPDQKFSKLARLRKRPCIVGNPESIIRTDWLKEWSERMEAPRLKRARSRPKGDCA